MGLLRLVVVVLVIGLPGLGIGETEQGVWDEANALMQRIHQLLIAKGLCADRPDCVRKQYAFAAPVYAGLNVEVYQISDRELLSDMIKQCALVALRRPDMRRVELKIYAISKVEELDTPFFVRVPHKTVTIAN